MDTVLFSGSAICFTAVRTAGGEGLGGTALTVGMVVAGYKLSALVSNMISGRASDIYARRWIIRFGLLCAILAFLSQALVTYYTSNIPLFILARIFGGLAAGIFPNALLAFVYEDTGKVGVFTSRGSLGWATGMMTAGIIGFFPVVFLFATLLFAICFAISLGLEPLGEKRMRIPFFPKELIKKNRDIYGSLLIRHTGACMIWVTFPIFIADLGGTRFWIGAIYAINMAAQFVLMPFMDRFDPKKLITLGLITSVVTFVWFSTATVWWHLLPSQLLLGAGWAMLYVGSLKLVLDRSEEKATSTGVLASTLSLGGLLGPLIGGMLADIFGYRFVMFVAAGMAVVGLLWFYSMRQKVYVKGMLSTPVV